MKAHLLHDSTWYVVRVWINAHIYGRNCLYGKPEHLIEKPDGQSEQWHQETSECVKISVQPEFTQAWDQN